MKNCHFQGICGGAFSGQAPFSASTPLPHIFFTRFFYKIVLTPNCSFLFRYSWPCHSGMEAPCLVQVLAGQGGVGDAVGGASGLLDQRHCASVCFWGGYCASCRSPPSTDHSHLLMRTADPVGDVFILTVNYFHTFFCAMGRKASMKLDSNACKTFIWKRMYKGQGQWVLFAEGVSVGGHLSKDEVNGVGVLGRKE